MLSYIILHAFGWICGKTDPKRCRWGKGGWLSRPWQTLGILSAQLRQLLPLVKHFKTSSGLVCSPPVLDLSFWYDPWSEPHLSLIAWHSTLPLSLFCSQFPVSLYIPYLVVFSLDLVYFPWTWFIFPRPGLILSLALPCSTVRLFTCHRKDSTLVHCTISTLYSEPCSLQSEINFVTTPNPLSLFLCLVGTYARDQRSPSCRWIQSTAKPGLDLYLFVPPSIPLIPALFTTFVRTRPDIILE